MIAAMVDIETLGTGVDAAITSIGAVKFNPYSDWIGGMLKLSVNLQSSITAGMTVDGSTIEWWMEHAEVYINHKKEYSPELPLERALRELRIFVKDYEPCLFWSHGATFDLVILDVAYRKIGSVPPWSFRDVRDTRTLFDLVPNKEEITAILKSNDMKHDPVSDAFIQARAVQYAYKTLGVTNPHGV